MSFTSDGQESSIITRAEYVCKGCQHSISQPIIYNSEIWHNSCFNINKIWRTTYTIGILYFQINIQHLNIEPHLDYIWETFNDFDACIHTNSNILAKELKTNKSPMESAFIMDCCAVLLEQIHAMLWNYENLPVRYRAKMHRHEYTSIQNDLKSIVTTLKDYLDFCTREVKLGSNSAAILALSLRESRYAILTAMRYLILASLTMDELALKYYLQKITAKSYNLALLPVCKEKYGSLYECDTFSLRNVRYRHLLLTDTVKTSSLHRNGKNGGFIYVNYDGLSTTPVPNITPDDYNIRIKDTISEAASTPEPVFKHRRVPTVFRHDINEPPLATKAKKESVHKRISLLIDSKRNSSCSDACSRRDSLSVKVRFDDEIEHSSQRDCNLSTTNEVDVNYKLDGTSDSESVFSIKKKPNILGKANSVWKLVKKILRAELIK
ncbi:hypothetical protein HDV06_007180 [Boothiomyces sp. JEL0866]|nr:hypothetical protein HDV06_007180 [Boothiomyces sp. JEL0866]